MIIGMFNWFLAHPVLVDIIVFGNIAACVLLLLWTRKRNS